MKISFEWLSAFVDWIETDPDAIAERLTLCTAEVEAMEHQGKLLQRCCVGKILRIEAHPNADRLRVATVQTDDGEKTVVCGGTNMEVGMLVAFAHTGATVLWHGEELHTLEPATIRGVESQGMICAAEELELEALYSPLPEDGERPVMNVSRLGMSDAHVGLPLQDALGLNDVVFDISNTALTMRPDLFSHRGIARECVALGLARWKDVQPDSSLPHADSTASAPTIHLDGSVLLPRHLGIVLGVDAQGVTPDWMKKRLRSVGVRPVSLPVDITNYVAWEMGAPLHAFDAQSFKGDLRLRLSREGDEITTLDSKKRPLPAGVMVIEDDEGIVDLVGIMGAKRTAVQIETTQFYLHCLSADPVAMRKSIVLSGHRTDAATVYEKGVPPVVAEQSFVRAVRLFLELAPGAKILSSVQEVGESGAMPQIPLSYERVRETLGSDVTDAQIDAALRAVECDVQGSADERIVAPPLHRQRDLHAAHDLVEEIGRIIGYDTITPVMPLAPLRIPLRDERIHRLRDALVARGYLDVLPLAFCSPHLLAACGIDPSAAVAVQNPLGEEASLLRPALFPQLLAHAQRNLPRADENLRTFAIGTVFLPDGTEQRHCALLHAAKQIPSLATEPFLHGIHDARKACAAVGYRVQVRQASPSFACMHPARTAELLLGDQSIGTVFQVHPSVCERFDLPRHSAVAVLQLSALWQHAPQMPSATPLPAMPAIRYDETVNHAHTVPLQPILDALKDQSPLLESAVLHDVYGNAQTYRATVRFTYRAADRTLTEEEAKKAHAAVFKHFEALL